MEIYEENVLYNNTSLLHGCHDRIFYMMPWLIQEDIEILRKKTDKIIAGYSKK